MRLGRSDSLTLLNIVSFKMVSEELSDGEENTDTQAEPKKPPKRGIIYLSSIPPYMNVTRIREFFSEFGTVGRVYLQLADKGITLVLMSLLK